MTWSPAQAFAWLTFDGTTGTPTVGQAVNATITDDGVGLYTINFAVAFANAHFAFHGSARYNSASAQAGARCNMRRQTTAARTTTTAATQVAYTGTNVNYDSPEVGFVFVGAR